MCDDGGTPSDSSTLRKKGAVICLSATRLSRFPGSTLKVALIPLIFHEIAHQFGFGEAEARAFQRLADLHLKYRTPSSYRLIAPLAYFAVGHSFTGPSGMEDLHSLPLPVTCAVQASSAGENLERIFDGNLWTRVDSSNLATDERSILLDYNKNQTFSNT